MQLSIDRRYKFVRTVMEQAYPQMIRYYAARYSWGQPCDPMRAKDWAYLAGLLATSQCKGQPLAWDKPLRFPSGNQGSPSGLVDIYHDGWELLQDLGLYDPEEELI